MSTALRRTAAIAIALAALCAPARPALAAAGEAPVRYDEAALTVFVGGDYPAGSPFAGAPSRPDAPKQPISVPALARALEAAGRPGLLVDQGGGAWLLRSDVVVSPTARLEATAETIAALRLDSPPGRAPLRLEARGGHLLIRGVSVVAWDSAAGAVDRSPEDGRAFLLASRGGRMDLVDAEAAYLGWAPGEPSGLSWRLRATPGDPTTGATGSIVRSDVHHGYFGQYSFEAYGLVAADSSFHDNVVYGFDPHDGSAGFEVARNRVFHNGRHGIIFSRGCTANWVHDNVVYENGDHGIMLDRGSDANVVEGNLVYGNADGIAIFQSSGNLVRGNTLRENARGVRINATYDADDRFDALATDNQVVGNTIEGSAQYGVYLYERGDRNVVAGNTIAGSGVSGVYLRSGANTVAGNLIQENAQGVTIVGGSYADPGPGGPSYLAPASQPGRDNRVEGNTIIGNTGYGIRATGAEAVGNRWSANSVSGNGAGGIATQGGANGALAPPRIEGWTPWQAWGAALPGARVEVFSDDGAQGRFFEGAAVADAQGRFSVAAPEGWRGRTLTATQTDPAGSSTFADGPPAQSFLVALPLVAR